ncbi:hypothetical protein TWF192_007008 [Orbilia oligospora]|uniref:Uncharacterized protein n=1 Tax=Orbilia oligospora TaxID=2813651 RepID=A0A6G1ML01_ORBOL|nr:hypothetical protein TWF191_004801 [Orbilia oligospora]KAF3262334.1 hypothetical protein TWF192_007008 [Orbilia oligospora]
MATPLAITYSSPCSFLSYCISRSAARQSILSSFPPPSSSPPAKDTIIICSTRSTFIREILIDLNIPLDDIPPLNDTQELSSAQRLILQSPISALLTTDTISLVYCPTIHHLRAYLSSLSSSGGNTNTAINTPTPVILSQSEKYLQRPYLAIHSLLPLHHLSTEWSSQGLSRTLSSIVSTTISTSRCLLLSISETSVTFGIAAELPLINSRMMRNNNKKKGFYGGEGFEEEGEGGETDLRFVGRVGDVLKRWCRVIGVQEVMGGEGEGEEGDDGEEMMI